MQAHKQREQKKLGKDKLERVIDMMKGIEAHTVDPFLLNVDEIIRIVQEYFPEWDQPDELNLDAEAIHHLADALRYWDALVPIKERWEQLAVPEVATGTASRDELIGENILRDEAF